MNSKTLLLTKQISHSPKGGREMLGRVNHKILSAILGSNLFVFELRSPIRGKLHEIFRGFRGHIDGLSDETIEQVLAVIRTQNVQTVFLDGSNLGGIIPAIKSIAPKVEIITYFHNIEARFFWGALKTTKTVRALGVLLANYLVERKSALLSDKRICLSRRDSKLLEELYGKGATHIMPMVLEDAPRINTDPIKKYVAEPFAIFVGGNFYANRTGIHWFVQNVAPRINIKILIIGKGMDKIRANLEIPGRVHVIGEVDSLVEWYRGALFAIAPIFDGSGMKTKVAEALMYGKKVVGTPEAFSGYEEASDAVGWCCTNVDEFVTAIEVATRTIHTNFDPALRKIYEDKYSLPAATARLRQVLSEEALESKNEGVQSC